MNTKTIFVTFVGIISIVTILVILKKTKLNDTETTTVNETEVGGLLPSIIQGLAAAFI
jgi:hypothetical protein